MNRRRLQTSLLIGLFVVSFFSVLQGAMAASRKELLEEFCLNNQDDNGAFADTPNGTLGEYNEFTTFSNLASSVSIAIRRPRKRPEGVKISLDKYVIQPTW